jgi:hypothetical protein
MPRTESISERSKPSTTSGAARATRALTGKSHEYGWIIASHVIEHTPDFIRFLQGCDDVLDETGQLSLAIPDKRYTFDHLRENSSLSAIIEAYEQKRTTHSPGSVADYFSNISHPRRGARFLSRRMRLESSAFIHTHDDTMAAIQTARNGGFLDIHAWCFTPSSFRLLIEDLYRLGYIKLRESAYLGASRNEFFIALSRSGAGCWDDKAATCIEITAGNLRYRSTMFVTNAIGDPTRPPPQPRLCPEATFLCSNSSAENLLEQLEYLFQR